MTRSRSALLALNSMLKIEVLFNVSDDVLYAPKVVVVALPGANLPPFSTVTPCELPTPRRMALSRTTIGALTMALLRKSPLLTSRKAEAVRLIANFEGLRASPRTKWS